MQATKIKTIKTLQSSNKALGAALLGLLFVLLLVAYFFVSPQITGDEPHYLIADRALAHYHTFDLKAVYQHEDYFGYYPAHNLLPQGDPALISMDRPHVYPMHGVGLSVFLLPGYILASKAGAVVQMILVAVGVVWLTWLWCKRVTGNDFAAYCTAALLTVCYFFTGLSGYLYPDMLIAAAGLLCLLILTAPSFQRPVFQYVIGLVLSFLVFLHYRNIDIALPVLAVFAYKYWRSGRKLPWIAFALVLGFLMLFLLTLHAWFGVWNPARPYGNLTSLDMHVFSHISAMMFDSSRGLFIYNPALLLLVAGLPIWIRKYRKTLLITLIVIGPSMAVLSLFTQWTGGAAPVGRYIMAFLPALTPAIAAAIERLRIWWQWALVAVAASASLLISLDAIVNKFSFVDYSSYRATPVLFEQLKARLGLNLEPFVPAYTNTTHLIGKFGPIKLLFWYAILALVVAYGYYLSKTKHPHPRQRHHEPI